MRIDDNSIAKLLVQENYVTKQDIVAAKAYASEHKTSIQAYLLKEELVTKDLIGQATAESFKVPYADLNSNKPSSEQTLRISEKTAREYRVVLFTETNGVFTVTTDDPKKEGLSTALKKIFTKGKIHIAYSLPEDIDATFLYYQKPLATRFSQIIGEGGRVAPELLSEIFNDAFVFRASDIHFEPQPAEALVRFRVDGVLREAGRVPLEFYENILNRIKVQAQLRIDEHYGAQDGSLRFEGDQHVFDLRVSIVPTVMGEKVVLRVLSSYIEGLGLGELGLSDTHQSLLESAAKKPFGMILVTGPTGSGKTTSLYAVLRVLQNPQVNITTIEDPVEYKVLGINQIQVNKQTDLTFSRGLRSIVRQDPDVILVGEIRDHETAEIAVNAALTGHLLLSTFHANDAATSIPRLLDMGVEPFILASTLELIIAQRLVRTICENCRYSVEMSAKELQQRYPDAHPFLKKEDLTLYAGKGCSTCANTGYDGRTALFEFIAVTPELQELMLSHPSTKEVSKLTRTQGTRSLFEDGLDKVLQGVTTIDELFRIAQPPDHIDGSKK